VWTPLPDQVQLGHLDFPAATSLVLQRTLAQEKSGSAPQRTMLLDAAAADVINFIRR
jgi:hypothetical protein